MRQRVMATSTSGTVRAADWRAGADPRALGDIGMHHRRVLPVIAPRISTEAGSIRFDLVDESRRGSSKRPRLRAIGAPLPTMGWRCCLELGAALRKALTALLDRRLVAGDALNRFLRGREMRIERRARD